MNKRISKSIGYDTEGNSLFRIDLIAILVMYLILGVNFSFAQKKESLKLNTAKETGYAPIDGLKLYYEIYGSGNPLVLLHGGLGEIEMFGPNLSALSKNHKVIAVDLQGHGRTADIDRPLSYESMADDIAGLLKYLKIDKVDIMGYSLGGEVALQTAIRYPDIINKLILVSTAFKKDGWYPEIIAGEKQMLKKETAEQMKQTPIFQAYAGLAPKPEDWSKLVEKLGKLLEKKYDWSTEVKKIKSPTLLVFGDDDAIRITHAVEFFELLGGGQRDAGWDGSGKPKSQLAILPNVTHYDIFMNPKLSAEVITFLDAPINQNKSFIDKK
jgi:pimeloyl-ACP methyl ester carboxylesterase